MLNLGKSPLINTLIAESELTVGNAILVPVLAATAGKYYQGIFKNVSGAAQTIRIGLAPGYGAPVKGILLAVNDTLVLDLFSHNLNAIASAGGALLDVLIYSN